MYDDAGWCSVFEGQVEKKPEFSWARKKSTDEVSLRLSPGQMAYTFRWRWLGTKQENQSCL